MAFSITPLSEVYLNARAYAVLTDRGDSAIAQKALEAAEIWVTALYAKANLTPDLTHSATIEAIYTYAVYWLYSRNDQDVIAADKLKQARTLIEAALGEAGAADPSSPRPSGPLGYCAAGESTPGWEGYP